MKVLFGVSGSVGVLGIHNHLIRLVQDFELELTVVMTPSAARFISPDALSAACNSEVLVDFWDGRRRTPSNPAELAEGSNAMIIAPASAATIARCAQGLSDTLLSACYLAHQGGTAWSPVMSPKMRNHIAVQRNLQQLQDDGSVILKPSMAIELATGCQVAGGLAPYDEVHRFLSTCPPIQTRRTSSPLGDC